MLRRFFRTDGSFAPLILRVVLGLVFLPHGAQKVLGLFGGHGLNATINYFTGPVGLPLAVALLVISAEFLGALGLIIGFLTRLCGLGIACVMSGAIYMVHFQNGFFMNWAGDKPGEGYEFHLLAIGMALALMLTGGGRWSVDRWLARAGNGGHS